MGLFTSLGHPWGGAPTYILPEYVTGVQTAVGPEGFGYKQWTLKPQLGLDMGLDEASSETMTVFGKPLKVSWKTLGQSLSIVVDAPIEASGLVELGGEKRLLAGSSNYHLDIEVR